MDILQVIRLTENIRKNSAKLSASLVNGESTVQGQAVRLMGTVRGSRTGEAAVGIMMRSAQAMGSASISLKALCKECDEYIAIRKL